MTQQLRRVIKERCGGEVNETGTSWSSRLLPSFACLDFAIQRMINCPPSGASAMNTRWLGTDRLRLKLRIMSDEDLWWLFLHHREECSNEFWKEVENRKAAGTLFKGSPFWTIRNLARYLQRQDPADNSNLIDLPGDA